MGNSEAGGVRHERRFAGWLLVAAAALLMGAAGIYQFGWSSIRLPLGARLGAPEPALGTIFTLFIVFQTVSQFPAGWVRDRYGPRLPLVAGAGLLFVGFAGIGVAESLPGAYLAYSVGGVGAGICYTIAINTPVKWFTARRGLATGIVGMAYSAVSFVLIPGIRRGVEVDFRTTVLVLGALAAVIALLGAVVLRDPGAEDEDENPGADTDEGATDATDDTGSTAESFDADSAYRWREAVRTWQFWLLYVALVVINGVGLMLIGKAVAYATALDLQPATATASASFIALADAGGLLVVSSLSDRLGRKRTVSASVTLAGLALGAAVIAGQQGVGIAFVVFAALTAFFRSPPFAIVPSLVGSYYGRAYSSEVYAVLYSSKLFGGIIGGTVASGLVLTLGWSESFGLGAALLTGAGVSLVFLRPVADR